MTITAKNIRDPELYGQHKCFLCKQWLQNNDSFYQVNLKITIDNIVSIETFKGGDQCSINICIICWSSHAGQDWRFDVNA